MLNRTLVPIPSQGNQEEDDDYEEDYEFNSPDEPARPEYEYPAYPLPNTNIYKSVHLRGENEEYEALVVNQV